MRFVLDASVALTWFLSEGEAQTAYSLLVLEDAVDGNTCVVPGLWHIMRMACDSCISRNSYGAPCIGGTMITEHASIVLTVDIPAAGLEAGDVGVVVHVHRGSEAYEVEFMTLDGGTLTIQTLEARQIRAAGNLDIPHVRERVAA